MPGGYHIRINLTNPTLTQVPPESSSFKQTSISPLSHNSTLAFTPTSLFESLPAHPRKQTARRYTIHHHSQFAPEEEESRAGKGSDSSTPPTHCDQKDYRFGPLRIDWVDFDTMDLDSAKKGAVGKEKETAKRGGPAIASFSTTTTRSKSGTANLPEGIVHIYRELPHQTYSSVVSTSHPPILPPISQSGGNDKKKAESDGVLMAVLAVPSWMTPADFLAFVAPAAEGMAHLRMIRDSTPNRSMVVVKFRNASDAAEFAEAYNGKQFNSMESEICHVVRVLSVEIETDDNVSQAIARIGEAESDTYELPTCPVCLERMDSAVTGLVTVPCSHTFHCTCLSKWGDSRCPVCRYSQTLMSSHPTSANTSRSNVPIPFTSPTSTSYCSACPPPSPSSLSSSASSSNLWICLICGNIGCGRYRRAHAHAHYEQTTHLYALELETQRVWDYAGDGYVHRLIQNKADGKLVELPSAASSMTMGGSNRDINGGGGGPSAADALSAEKIEAIGIEYSYLLTSQLDSQRAYYETQTNELKIQVDELKEIVGKRGEEVEAKMVRMKEQEEARRKVEEERVGEIERARVKAEKRAEKFVEVARALEKELKAERAQSEGLLKNLTAAKAKAEKAEEVKESLRAKVTELEEQVRDVMFFVEARDKIEQGEGVVGEAAGGSVAVPVPATNGKKKKGKKG